MELDATRGEPRQLRDDVGHARVVEQYLTSVPRRRVHGDIERRESILENPLDVPLLYVGERGEIAVREGKPVIVVAHVEVLPQTRREPLDEAELAAVGAAAYRPRHELAANGLAVGSFDLANHRLPPGQPPLQHDILATPEQPAAAELGK